MTICRKHVVYPTIYMCWIVLVGMVVLIMSYIDPRLLKLFLLYKFNKLTPCKAAAEIIKLGPTYVKLAQILSNRNDILSSCYCEKFKSFQFDNDTYTLDKESAIDILTKSTTVASKLNFHTLERIATGSIATVYTCEMKSNKVKVIVKLLNQNTRKLIMHDIKTIKYYYQLIQIVDAGELSQLMKMFDINEFTSSILSQTYFTNEVNNINLCTEDFKDHDRVVIPTVYHHSDEYIIESYEEGYHIPEFLHNHPDEARYVVALLLGTLTTMVLDKNRIHADLHEGNFKFRMSSNNETQILLYDFGYMSTSDFSTLVQVRKVHAPISILMNPVNFGTMVKSVSTNGDVDGFIDDLENSAGDYIEFFNTLRASPKSVNTETLIRYIKRNITGLDYGFTNIFTLLKKHYIGLPMHNLIIATNYFNLVSILSENIENLEDIMFESYITGIQLNLFQSNEIINALILNNIAAQDSPLLNYLTGCVQNDLLEVNNKIYEIDSILCPNVKDVLTGKKLLLDTVVSLLTPPPIDVADTNGIVDLLISNLKLKTNS